MQHRETLAQGLTQTFVVNQQTIDQERAALVVHVVVVRIEQDAVLGHAAFLVITEILCSIEQFHAGDLVDCCLELGVVDAVLVVEILSGDIAALNWEYWGESVFALVRSEREVWDVIHYENLFASICQGSEGLGNLIRKNARSVPISTDNNCLNCWVPHDTVDQQVHIASVGYWRFQRERVVGNVCFRERSG